VDLFDVVRSCFRRWYVMLPLLLVTVWYSYQAYVSVKPVYYSQAVVGLAPPSFRIDQAAAGQPVARNGLLDVGGASLLANMTALGVRQPAVVERVVAAGGRPDFTAKMFPVPPTASPIPLIMIEQTAPTPDAAKKTLQLVIGEVTASLKSLQQNADVPPETMVATFVVAPPSEPVAAVPSRTRATASIFVAGLGLSVVVTVLVDVLLGRRRKKSVDAAPQTPSGRPPSRTPSHAIREDAPDSDELADVNESAAEAR
jgi:hypothetical protein